VSEQSSSTKGGHRPIVLFDGVCSLCNASVRWIIEHDRQGVFDFAALQSKAGARALERAGVDPTATTLPDSIVLIDGQGVRTASEAVIGVARRLGLPWSLIAAARLLPRGMRDGLYSVIAWRRHRWFGTQSSCMVPSAETRARFLDADEIADAGLAPEAAPAPVDDPRRPPVGPRG